MTGIEHARQRAVSVVTVELVVTSQQRPPGTNATSVLPSPLPLGAGATASAIGQLYLLVAQRRDRNADGATVEIEAAQKDARACLDREAAALARERSHREDSGSGVFASLGKLVSDLVDDVTSVRVSDAFDHLSENTDAALNSPKFWAELERGATVVAKVAAVAASAAGTVATFGAAGPVLVAVVIAVSLSAASVVQDETRVLQKLGVDENAAHWASFGCAVAGAIITGGAGTASAAGQASQFSNGMRGFSLASGALGGGATMTAGGAHIERGRHAALAEDAVADRREAIHANARMVRQLDALVEAFTESDKSVSRTLESLQGVVHAQGQALVLSTARV